MIKSEGSEEVVATNFECLMRALQELGLTFPLTLPDCLENPPQPRNFLLLALYLFQMLPHYVPKTTIAYQAVLGVPMTKSIELSNPSKKPVSYICRVFGGSGVGAT